MSLMDQLTKVVVAQATQSVAQKTGLSAGMAEKMMPMAMAVLMNGLQNNTAKTDGAQALSNALDRHDGGLLDNLTQLGSDNVLSDGQKILGHILGGNQRQAEQQMAQAAGGIDQKQIGALLAMAAPVVLGALGKAKREQGLDVNALAGLIKEEAPRANVQAESQLSGLAKMLDKDGDGNLQGEALAIGKQLLGGLFGGKR